MNVIFMGTPDYAEKILYRLIEEDGINVVAVYTQPDKPVGRKKVITAPEVKKLALENNIDASNIFIFTSVISLSLLTTYTLLTSVFYII